MHRRLDKIGQSIKLVATVCGGLIYRDAGVYDAAGMDAA
jgi:hypothetical protein